MSTQSTPGSRPARDPRAGPLGVLFAAVWLAFLLQPLQEAWSQRDTLRGLLGIAATLGFAAAYLLVVNWARGRRRLLADPVELPLALGQVALMALLAGAMCVTVGQAGTAAFVFVAVIGVLMLPTAGWVLLALALVATNELTSRVVSGWTADPSLSFAICAAAFAMWGIEGMIRRNLDLLKAREENARLAVAEERNRFARDLHDILGHSLTVVTVKAELASRLLDVDRERARAELADLERLSRDALADVRRAVDGYRDVSLPAELARARMALQAAEIEAELPNSTDEVPTALRELFAWTVREGVTNVIRHSGATTCTVLLEPSRVVVSDDGAGPCSEADPGHGLEGLRERATAAGAVLLTRTLEPRGFQLQVALR